MLFACSSQKDTATSRAMQNLTSRYNYIYNANLILDDYVSDLQNTYADNFAEIVPVYVNPPAFNPAATNPLMAQIERPELEEIINKARTIIADKSYGNYIDDAYLLMGKGYFYKGDYFTAAEYFDYTAQTYKQDKKTLLDALNWKIRSYMQLNNLKAAAPASDSLETLLDSVKHHRAEPLATLAQMSMELKRDKEATTYLLAALKAGGSKADKIRWTYILAQLYERQNDAASALKYYRKVQGSNAGFQLYFNANLNRIKLNAEAEGRKTSRSERMQALLKDDKNADFIDQVYYHIANVYAEEHSYAKAAAYYSQSVQTAGKDPYQKGIAYLKLADLNFNTLKNYIQAKAYYDSAVNTLPKSYPNYDQISKKNKNLQNLTDRYVLIALQDTLQAIAKLPEQDRLAAMEQYQSAWAMPQQTYAAAPLNQASNPVRGNGTFYFDNQNAVSIAALDFKKRWGNRKQEDNWRQSIRTNGETNTQKPLTANVEGIPTDPDQVAPTATLSQVGVADLMASLPTSPVLLQASNQKIINAYYEIASFYQQELNDRTQAIEVYERLLRRYPENNFLPAINYSLYLAYKDTDPDKAKEYKNIVLTRYANSVYAKSILDPGFSVKQSELDRILEIQYNGLFASYQAKDFPKVIKTADELSRNFPGNYLEPQFEYLKAIGIGRTQHVDSLLAIFNKIKTQFPGDQLIVPLVESHLTYIQAHLGEFRRRKIALADFDPNESPFAGVSLARRSVPADKASSVSADATKTQATKRPVAEGQIAGNKPESTIAANIPAITTAIETKPKAEAVASKPNSIFSVVSTSNTYYFVVDVADATLTLSSSRFGIGQFNRGNYAERDLRHRLVEFDDDQLIYVGNFSSFDEVKQYADGITPQLKKIMKVPESKYSAFIISKENFEKLKSKALVLQYLDFYKTNY
jgi:tetratricopeptide (TPR) repeat protein